jgi:hypothetical protein
LVDNRERLLFSRANVTVRFRSEACFQVVGLIGRGEQVPKVFWFFFSKKFHTGLWQTLLDETERA